MLTPTERAQTVEDLEVLIRGLVNANRALIMARDPKYYAQRKGDLIQLITDTQLKLERLEHEHANAIDLIEANDARIAELRQRCLQAKKEREIERLLGLAGQVRELEAAINAGGAE